jgi:hypothetical protein
MKFEVGGFEAGFAFDRELHHGETILRGGGFGVRFVRRPVGGNEKDAVEAEFLEGGAGEDEMPVMDRVEAAAEDAGVHGESVALQSDKVEAAFAACREG